VDATTFTIDGNPSAKVATCKGDSGGPALREADGGAELVGVNSASWQNGCYQESEQRTGATEARTDDVSDWIRKTAIDPVLGDVGGDAKADISAFYNYDNDQTKLWVFSSLTGSVSTRMAWDSGRGNWDWGRGVVVSESPAG
jgi:hypothetical protein